MGDTHSTGKEKPRNIQENSYIGIVVRYKKQFDAELLFLCGNDINAMKELKATGTVNDYLLLIEARKREVKK